jgi:hypothetical protein
MTPVSGRSSASTASLGPSVSRGRHFLARGLSMPRVTLRLPVHRSPPDYLRLHLASPVSTEPMGVLDGDRFIAR